MDLLVHDVSNLMICSTNKDAQIDMGISSCITLRDSWCHHAQRNSIIKVDVFPRVGIPHFTPPFPETSIVGSTVVRPTCPWLSIPLFISIGNMRVINTKSFEFKHERGGLKFREEGYAILSHRWLDDEITYHQYEQYVEKLKSGSKENLSPQLDKIRGACDIAHSKGIEWMWIDSCCINKRDTEEATESINSMFMWYRQSKLCVTFLSDVELNTEFKPKPGFKPTDPRIFNRSDNNEPAEWFFRGWTLQELLAPREMEFYDKKWNLLGTKADLQSPLSKLTGINESYLTGADNFRNACIATKMSWMAKRTTKLEEDLAYAMLGIFDINMLTMYGEGARAFLRLQQVLLSSPSMDESLYAWKMPAPTAGHRYNRQGSAWREYEWGLLAPCPAWFADSGGVRVIPNALPSREPFKVTGEGLTAPVGRAATDPSVHVWHFIAMSGLALGCIPGIPPIMYLKHIVKEVLNADATFGLNCFEVGNDGRKKQVGIYLRPVSRVESEHIRSRFPWLPVSGPYRRIRCNEFGLGSEKFESAPGLVAQPAPADL